MKNSVIFVLAVSFIVFSCSGTPNSNTTKPLLPQHEENRIESSLSSVPESFIETPPLEEFPAEELSMDTSSSNNNLQKENTEFGIMAESDAAGFSGQNDITADTKIEEYKPVTNTELITEIAPIEPQPEPQIVPQLESQVAPQVAQVPEVPLEQPVQLQDEIPNTLLHAPAAVPVQTQSVQSLPQSQAQTQPPIQLQPQSQAQTQVQSSPQVQAQPPVQTQTQQSQPTAQVARQPQSVQTPLPLAPAEERTAAELENVPARTEPLRLDTAKDEAVTPFQTVLTPQNETVVFSRIVRATAGQIIEIPFRGTGWVYMGELASRRGIVYDSRRLDPEGQSFIFMIEDAGTYALKFFRQDFVRDYVLNDYVQVIAGEAPVSSGTGWFNPPVDRGRVAAPRWPTALEEAEIMRGGTGSRPAETQPVNASERGTVSSQDSALAGGTASAQSSVPTQQTAQPQTTASALPQTAAAEAASQQGVIEAPLPPDVILQKAKDSFDSGNVSAAIALLDQYNEYYNSGTDELYWLYGQFYEANSPSRNILLSLDYYRRLVREYPQSRRYNDARGRIAYLERYYINIQ